MIAMGEDKFLWLSIQPNSKKREGLVSLLFEVCNLTILIYFLIIIGYLINFYHGIKEDDYSTRYHN